MFRIKRILCPVDFSPASDHAAEYATHLAKNNDASLRLFHVVSPLIPSAYEYPIDTTGLIKSMEKAATRQLSRLVNRLKKTGLKVEGVIQVGDTVGQIKDEIESYKPDLVTMGTHGRGLLDRLFLGSTAERVVRAALCPVMVIPPSSKAAPKAKPRKSAA